MNIVTHFTQHSHSPLCCYDNKSRQRLDTYVEDMDHVQIPNGQQKKNRVVFRRRIIKNWIKCWRNCSENVLSTYVINVIVCNILVSPSRHNLIDLTGQDDDSLCGIYKENKFQAGEATSKTLFLFYILVLKESRKRHVCLCVCSW